MKSSKQHSYSLEQHFNRKVRGEAEKRSKLRPILLEINHLPPPPPSKYRAKPGTLLTFLLNRKEFALASSTSLTQNFNRRVRKEAQSTRKLVETSRFLPSTLKTLLNRKAREEPQSTRKLVEEWLISRFGFGL